METLSIPAAVGLARRLGAIREPLDERRLGDALGLARVLAHVTTDTGVTAMRAAGWGSFPGERREADADPAQRPRLSEVRFRRLLQTGSGEEQVFMFTRLIRLIGGEVNVAALARDYLAWYWDSTRHRWAFEYYAAAVAAPAFVQPTGDES
jgi:CRISPR type I-E-associated protein CasB/Cse2